MSVALAAFEGHLSRSLYTLNCNKSCVLSDWTKCAGSSLLSSDCGKYSDLQGAYSEEAAYNTCSFFNT